MKKILITILLVASGATGWLLIEPTLSDDVVNDTPIVSRENTAVEIEQTNESQSAENQENELVSSDEKEVILEEKNSSDIAEPKENIEKGEEPKPVSTTPEVKETVLSGTFRNGKARYKATGEVFVSGRDLSLVSLDSTNVPDGFVYLSNDLNAIDAVRIQKLQGNVGNQNYRLPANVDAGEYKYVLIWCRAFSSLIGYAEIN